MNEARAWAVLGSVAALAVAATFLFLPPIPQSASYHEFADRSALLGIPHSLDVLSNFGFLIVGAWGLAFVGGESNSQERRPFLSALERWPYVFFFVGVFLTTFGSAYYHLRPDNARLVWDRLPMAAAFMGLLAAVIAERVNVRLGIRLLMPLVVLGIGSVLYWRRTELAGRGDLRLYALVQFGSIAMLLLIASLLPSRYTRGCDIFVVAGFYGLAKLLEYLDRPIFSISRTISGHTLKHVAAALACYGVLRMLKLRKPAGLSPGIVARAQTNG